MTTDGTSFWTTFMPHGQCYMWRPDILWLNVLSDAFIAAAYFFIPVCLFLVLRRKPNTPYRPLVIMFSAFILSCGVTHVMSIWSVWHGDYGLVGLSKAVTAVVSVATVVMLVPWLPKITRLKSPDEQQLMNQQLQHTIERQERYNQKLGHTEERLRTFLQQAPDGILIVHSNSGLIEYSNDMINTMFGVNSDDLNGRYIIDLLPERSRHKLRPDFNDLFDEERARSRSAGAELTGMRKDGKEFPIEVRMTPIYSEHDGGEVVLATLRDISDRKRNEERSRKQLMELVHVSRLSTVGEMAAGLAHELNQPLTAISNNLHTAMAMQNKKANPDQDLLEIMQENYQSAQRAGQIIRSLRQLVRKDDGSKTVANINDLIQATINLIVPEAKAEGVQVKLELDDKIPATTLIDAVQIQQVMVNLGRNAIEALTELVGTEERLVTVGTTNQDAENILVYVMDNGPGLDDEIKANLFQPYLTSKESGMGLGLSICRTIVESQGGHLWHEKVDAQRTAFYFTIPVVTGDKE